MDLEYWSLLILATFQAFCCTIKQREVEAFNTLTTFQAILLLFVPEMLNARVRQI